MKMIEIAVYVIFVFLTVGSIGWYLYGVFRTPPPLAPIPPEQISALRQEKEILLKEDQIYGTRHPYIFSFICLIAFRLACDDIPKNPPGAKPADDKRQTQIAILGVVSFIIYSVGLYAINQNTRKAVKAALGDDARPSMPDGPRSKRLKEIEKQLKHSAAQSLQSDSRS